MHASRLRSRGLTHEAVQICGLRYPKLNSVSEGTIFKMTDEEDEYEIVGKVAITKPLYDGGKARIVSRDCIGRPCENGQCRC